MRARAARAGGWRRRCRASLPTRHACALPLLAAVCHGPCGLVTAKSPGGSDSILKGRQVAGFSNSEEQAVGKTNAVPFLLEDRLKELGGDYVRGPDWVPFAGKAHGAASAVRMSSLRGRVAVWARGGHGTWQWILLLPSAWLQSRLARSSPAKTRRAPSVWPR